MLLQNDKTKRQEPQSSGERTVFKNQINDRIKIYHVVQCSSLQFVMSMPETF